MRPKAFHVSIWALGVGTGIVLCTNIADEYKVVLVLVSMIISGTLDVFVKEKDD